MNKQITKYKNEVNTIPMRDWTVEEMNFFFAILTQLRDESTRRIELGKRELAELANYSIEHNQRYETTIRNLGEKISNLTYWEKTSNSYMIMPLFTLFKASWNDNLTELNVKVSVNEEFEYILNQWELGGWTAFDLQEFTEINSTYSKTIFRLLKQWRAKGKREFSISEFRNLLSIPDSYKNSHINERIINNAKKDLDPYFTNLKIKTVKSNTRGRPVTGYIFTWKPEKTGDYDPHKFEKKSYGKPLKFETKPDWMTDDKQSANQQISTEKSKNIKDELQRKYPNFFDKN